MNTGTADAPTEADIRAYLDEFLTDTLLFQAPPFIWKRVVRWFILPKRPRKTLWRYRKMWTDKGFVFNLVSEAQRAAVAAELGRRGFSGGDFSVRLGMRYGNPSIMSQLKQLRSDGCDLLILVPLYPQCVTVCAGTCFAEVDRCREQLAYEGWVPDIIRVWDFYEQPAYIDAMARSIAQRWTYTPGSKLVYCWHSTLMADLEIGDPYREQCEATARAVSEKLGIPQEGWTIAYQSRFDNRKWLQPFCNEVIPQLGRDGVTDVCTCCPGFVADNLENVTETGEDLKNAYLEQAPAGSRYTFVPALNEDPGLIEAVANAIVAAPRDGVVESVTPYTMTYEPKPLFGGHPTQNA